MEHDYGNRYDFRKIASEVAETQKKLEALLQEAKQRFPPPHPCAHWAVSAAGTLGLFYVAHTNEKKP